MPMFEKKNILSACIGTTGLALIFISIMLLLTSDVEKTTTIEFTTTKPWAEDNCLFSTMKITDRAMLTFCYDRQLNEQLTIYCNGTAVAWSKDAIRRASKFLKRVFESMEPLDQRSGYNIDLIPYMSLYIENGVLRYAILEQKCTVSAYAVYTLYHWFCF